MVILDHIRLQANKIESEKARLNREINELNAMVASTHIKGGKKRRHTKRHRHSKRRYTRRN